MSKSHHYCCSSLHTHNSLQAQRRPRCPPPQTSSMLSCLKNLHVLFLPPEIEMPFPWSSPGKLQSTHQSPVLLASWEKPALYPRYSSPSQLTPTLSQAPRAQCLQNDQDLRVAGPSPIKQMRTGYKGLPLQPSSGWAQRWPLEPTCQPAEPQPLTAPPSWSQPFPRRPPQKARSGHFLKSHC